MSGPPTFVSGHVRRINGWWSAPDQAPLRKSRPIAWIGSIRRPEKKRPRFPGAFAVLIQVVGAAVVQSPAAQ